MPDEILTLERLASAEAVFTLGLVVVKALRTEGAVTLFINKRGEVEICPRLEVPLDGLPEQEALELLLTRGYSDEQLAAYLRGREARTSFQKHEQDLRPESV